MPQSAGLCYRPAAAKSRGPSPLLDFRGVGERSIWACIMAASTILVTGAAGVIGSHAAQALLAAGYRVVGVDNFGDFYDRSWKEMNLKCIAASGGKIDVEELDITDGPRIS